MHSFVNYAEGDSVVKLGYCAPCCTCVPAMAQPSLDGRQTERWFVRM